MRGDSRRDLYSKALALCGLGVLAGAGALVDYWPVGVRFPVAQSPLAEAASAPATDRSSPDDVLVTLTGLMAAARVAEHDRVARATTAPAEIATAHTYPSLPVIAAGADIGTSLELESLPPPVFINVRHDPLSLPVVPVGLTAPAAQPVERGDAREVAAADDGSFITTAFRRTGSSIVRGGMKTGTSLVDAVRVVGSVVRRALPD